MPKDVQIFFGVQVNGQKHVVNKMIPIEKYNMALNPKAFLNAMLDESMINLKDELKEKGLL